MAASGLGVAFLITLVVLAWDNALETELRRFGFESLSVDETVRGNVKSAHDALGNLAKVVGVVPELSEKQFNDLANGTLGQFQFITAIGRYGKSAGAGSNNNSYELGFAVDSNASSTLPQIVDLNAAGGYGTVFSLAEFSTGRCSQ